MLGERRRYNSPNAKDNVGSAGHSRREGGVGEPFKQGPDCGVGNRMAPRNRIGPNRNFLHRQPQNRRIRSPILAPTSIAKPRKPHDGILKQANS
jgi:hypothetical protein